MSGSMFGAIFGVIGVFALLIGLFLYFRQGQFMANARPARGVVTGIRTTRDDDGDDMYAPVVEFRTESGVAATYRSSLYSRPNKYKIGDAVEILYNPEKPEDAQIKGRTMNYAPAMILGGIGLVFVVLGAAVFVVGAEK